MLNSFEPNCQFMVSFFYHLFFYNQCHSQILWPYLCLLRCDPWFECVNGQNSKILLSSGVREKKNLLLHRVVVVIREFVFCFYRFACVLHFHVLQNDNASNNLALPVNTEMFLFFFWVYILQYFCFHIRPCKFAYCINIVSNNFFSGKYYCC